MMNTVTHMLADNGAHLEHVSRQLLLSELLNLQEAALAERLSEMAASTPAACLSTCGDLLLSLAELTESFAMPRRNMALYACRRAQANLQRQWRQSAQHSE